MAYCPVTAQHSSVRAVPGLVLSEPKPRQNPHLSVLLCRRLLFPLASMFNVPWLRSLRLCSLVYRMKTNRKQTTCLWPVFSWKRQNAISICFMYFLGPKCDFFSPSCYCRTEEHIPRWGNVLPFWSYCDDLLALISSRSGDWQRIIPMIALISGCAQSRNARLSAIALRVSPTTDLFTSSVVLSSLYPVIT